MTADPRLRYAPFMTGSAQPPYLRSGMIRLLSSLFVALALFASPLMMANGAGMAMSHAMTKSAPDAAGHCSGEETPSDQEDGPVELGCASACAVFLADHQVAVEEPPIALAVLARTRGRSIGGIHPEGETPPPRITPKI